jgi:hypothetical protein
VEVTAMRRHWTLVVAAGLTAGLAGAALAGAQARAEDPAQQDERDRLRKELEKKDDLLKAREAEIDRLRKALAEKDDRVKVGQAEAERLRKELADLDKRSKAAVLDQQGRLKEALGRQEKTFKELESQRDQGKRLTEVVQTQTELAARAARELAESRDLYAKAQQEIRKRAEEVRKREVELRDLQVTHEVHLKRSLQLQDRVRELEANLETVRKALGRAGQAAPEPAPAPGGANEVQGTVKRVADELVVISLGGKAGIVKGQTLEVFRTKPMPVYLGKLRLIDVKETEAVGKLLPGGAKKPVEVGDTVASKVMLK